MLKKNYLEQICGKSFKKIRGLVACGLFGLFAMSASAAIVTLEFEGITPNTTHKENTVLSGFNLSPSCHYDIGKSDLPGSSGNWIGVDMSGCIYEPDIATYLGPAGVGELAKLFISSSSDKLFDLLSLNFALPTLDSGGALRIFSSNGGFAAIDRFDGIFSKHSFVGPEWTDLSWLVFSTGDVGHPVGFDNLALNVHDLPEPGSLALFFLGLAGIFWHRRRRSS